MSDLMAWAAVAYVGKDVVSKILGPTADYLGKSLKEVTQKRWETIGKIFLNAEKKLGNKMDVPGQVPPKILKTIINDGSFSNDEISVEYFGGVLASSRTEFGRDDRGYRMLKIMDQLSAYQIRSHYLIYSTISELFSQSEVSFGLPENRKAMNFFMPIIGYLNAMEFTNQEWNNGQILGPIFNGLEVDGLIGDNWNVGGKEDLNKYYTLVPGEGIICFPSLLGVELFLWAFGYGDQKPEFLLTDNMSANIIGISKSVENSVAIRFR